MKRWLIVLFAVALVGCPYTPRAPEVMGPGLANPMRMQPAEVELGVVGYGGAWWDTLQSIEDATVGVRGNIDIGLAPGVSLVVDSGVRWGSGHLVISSARAGPRFRLLDHLFFGFGFGSSLGGLSNAPYIGADLELGVGGQLGPVILSAVVRGGITSVAVPGYTDLGWYVLPELGVVIHPWEGAPAGPYIAVGGHVGSAITGGWRSLEIHGTAGVLARLPALTLPGSREREEDPWEP